MFVTEATSIVLLGQWRADGGAGETPLRRHLYRQLQPLPQTDGCQKIPELSLNREEKVSPDYSVAHQNSLDFKSAAIHQEPSVCFFLVNSLEDPGTNDLEESREEPSTFQDSYNDIDVDHLLNNFQLVRTHTHTAILLFYMIFLRFSVFIPLFFQPLWGGIHAPVNPLSHSHEATRSRHNTVIIQQTKTNQYGYPPTHATHVYAVHTDIHKYTTTHTSV